MILLRSVLHSLGGFNTASAFRPLDGRGGGGNWTGPLRGWGGLVDVHAIDFDVDVVVDDGRGVDERGRRFEEGVESADLRVDAGLGPHGIIDGPVQQADRDDAAHLYSGRLCLAIQVGLRDHTEEPLSHLDARLDEARILPFFFHDLKSPRSKNKKQGGGMVPTSTPSQESTRTVEAKEPTSKISVENMIPSGFVAAEAGEVVVPHGGAVVAAAGFLCLRVAGTDRGSKAPCSFQQL
jgi:hypothetical protein